MPATREGSDAPEARLRQAAERLFHRELVLGGSTAPATNQESN